MASAKKTLNPLTDTPTTKTEITKPFMYAYMASSKASLEDVEWFSELCDDPEYRKEYKDQLHGTTYEDINVPMVREQFCLRFYPHLYQKKKSDAPKTFADKIKALKAQKEKEEREAKQ